MPTVRVCDCFVCVWVCCTRISDCWLSFVISRWGPQKGGPVSKCKLKWSWSWSGSRCLLQFHSEIKAALGAAYSHKLFISRSLGLYLSDTNVKSDAAPPPPPLSLLVLLELQSTLWKCEFEFCSCPSLSLSLSLSFVSFSFLSLFYRSAGHMTSIDVFVSVSVCIHINFSAGQRTLSKRDNYLLPSDRVGSDRISSTAHSAHSLRVLSNTIGHKTKRAIKACSNHINHGSFGSPCDTLLVPGDHQQHQQVLSICIDLGLTLP